MVFHPEPEELYPEGFCTYVENQSDMSKALCGKTRPIHFRGVCTVVSKLLNIVTPDRAYFGQKDAQQLSIIRRMVLDLSMDVEIVGCPIIREEDGLAKSSRNVYLSPEERTAALCLSRAVKLGQEQAAAGERDARKITAAMTALIEAEPWPKSTTYPLWTPPRWPRWTPWTGRCWWLLRCTWGKPGSSTTSSGRGDGNAT